MQSNTLFPISVDQYLAPPDPHVQSKIEGFGILAFIIAII